jgi:iron complex transport system substrate-binding protein
MNKERPGFPHLALFLATLLSIGLLMAACGGTLTPTATSPLAPEATPTASTGGLTVTDALGRTVEFATPPQRIVIAGKATLTIVDTMYLFPDARDRVIALSIGKQPVGDFLSLVDPNWEQKTILGVDAGPEQIAPLQPDAVLMRSSVAETLGRSLEALNIPVVYVDLETIDQYFRDVTTLGDLLADDRRAGDIVAYYQSRLDRLVRSMEELPGDEKPSVVVVQYSAQGGGEVALSVPSASWLQTNEVEIAGGIPAWKKAAQSGGWTVVNFEQIAAWDPDQIFVVSYQADSAAVVQQLKADPQWRLLRAVKGGQLYGFPADIFSWDQPDPRWILGVTWLAVEMHPDQFPDLDFQQEILSFFQQMYGMDQATVEQQILPQLKGDVG